MEASFVKEQQEILHIKVEERTRELEEQKNCFPLRQASSIVKTNY